MEVNLDRTSSWRRRARRAAAGLLLVAAAGGVRSVSAGEAGVDVVVRVSWNRERAERVSGVVTRVQYPKSLALETDPRDGSAKGHVERLTTSSGGLFDALVKDTDGDGAPDLLSVGLITPGIEPGDFVRIHFARSPGAASPDGATFGCVADVADGSGAVPATCSATIVAAR